MRCKGCSIGSVPGGVFVLQGGLVFVVVVLLCDRRSTNMVSPFYESPQLHAATATGAAFGCVQCTPPFARPHLCGPDARKTYLRFSRCCLEVPLETVAVAVRTAWRRKSCRRMRGGHGRHVFRRPQAGTGSAWQRSSGSSVTPWPVRQLQRVGSGGGRLVSNLVPARRLCKLQLNTKRLGEGLRLGPA